MRTRGVIAVVWGLAVGTAVWAGPSLMLEPATFDWGRQAENKGEYEFKFTVKNAGDEELRIDKVRPGCSCTKVELKKQNLAPGESTEMTGALTTKGIEGPMHKGIVLTSNDPLHNSTVANLSIRFPMNGEGLRVKGNSVYARMRQNALWAYVTVENCDPATAIKIEAMELPQGWDSSQNLPLTVNAEDRTTVTLTQAVAEGAEVPAFENLPFTLVTDFAKTPRVQGVLSYRPDPVAATVTPSADPAAAGGAGPKVRWPMAKPAGLKPQPIKAPPALPTPAPPPAGSTAPANPQGEATPAGAAPAATPPAAAPAAPAAAPAATPPAAVPATPAP